MIEREPKIPQGWNCKGEHLLRPLPLLCLLGKEEEHIKIGGRRELAPTEAAGGDGRNRCRGAVQVANQFVTGDAKDAR